MRAPVFYEGIVLVFLLFLPSNVWALDRVGPVLSVNLTTPQLFSVSGGIDYRFDSERNGKTRRSGLMAQVEPGIGGTKAYVGYYQAYGDFREVGVVWAIKASVLRTHQDLCGVASNQTYVGWELEGAIVPFLKISGGVYHHTAGDDPDERLVSVGIGWGI